MMYVSGTHTVQLQCTTHKTKCFIFLRKTRDRSPPNSMSLRKASENRHKNIKGRQHQATTVAGYRVIASSRSITHDNNEKCTKFLTTRSTKSAECARASNSQDIVLLNTHTVSCSQLVSINHAALRGSLSLGEIEQSRG